LGATVTVAVTVTLTLTLTLTPTSTNIDKQFMIHSYDVVVELQLSVVEYSCMWDVSSHQPPPRDE